jgi:hypothetical protein
MKNKRGEVKKMVDSTLLSNALVIEYVAGFSSTTGKNINKKQKVNCIKTEATDDDIYAVAISLATLLREVIDIRRSSEYSLS